MLLTTHLLLVGFQNINISNYHSRNTILKIRFFKYFVLLKSAPYGLFMRKEFASRLFRIFAL